MLTRVARCVERLGIATRGLKSPLALCEGRSSGDLIGNLGDCSDSLMSLALGDNASAAGEGVPPVVDGSARMPEVIVRLS